MLESIWFTSDTHFGHEAILSLGSGRPFSSVEEMDEAIIDRWNAMIAKSDRVYHLGDFSFARRERTGEIIKRLKGQKHFIRGNHDSGVDRYKALFQSYRDYSEIRVEGQKLVLFHFPILSWHQVGKSSWHLHGHCHGNLPEDPEMARMDVGVDTHDFYPWHYDEIVERLAGRRGVPGDHHDH